MEMDTASLWTFLLIFVRITSFMVTAPLLSGRQLPNPYKIGLSAILAILCVGVIQEPIESVELWDIAPLLLKEIFVGIILGMVANVFLYAVQLAGSIIDLHIGFAMATVFDPTFGTTTQLTGQFKNVLFILFFLATDGHHMLIHGVITSFEWITLNANVPAWNDGRISTLFLYSVKQMFLIGFMMAAPIIGTLFIVDIAMGIVSKTVPQMNFFAIFPPIKIMLHFILLIFVLPGFFYLATILVRNMYESMYSILNIMGA